MKKWYYIVIAVIIAVAVVLVLTVSPINVLDKKPPHKTTTTTSTTTTTTIPTTTTTSSTTTTTIPTTTTTSSTTTSSTTTTTIPTTTTTSSTTTTSTTTTTTIPTTTTTSSTTTTTIPTTTTTKPPTTTTTTQPSTTTTTVPYSTGKTYYVDNISGNDSSLDPTNINTPWKTVAKVNSSLPSGAICLFKRGVTWHNSPTLTPPSGTEKSYTVIGAYGTGNKPVFDYENTSAQTGVLLSGKSYIVLSNLNLYNPGRHGLQMYNNCHDIIAEYLDIIAPGGNDPSLAGNGVEWYASNNNCEVRYCYIENSWDEGMTIQSAGEVTNTYNIKFHHNIIAKCSMGMSFFGGAAGSSYVNIKIYNNIIWDTANGSNNNLNNHPAGFFSANFYNPSTIDNCWIVNNIFHTVKSGYPIVYWRLTSTGKYQQIPKGILWDYNCYYPDGPENFWAGIPFRYNFTGWLNNSWVIPNDAHSINADPKFVNPGVDFTLQPDSPCIGKGIPIPNIGAF